MSYEELYTSTTKTHHLQHTTRPFTMQELDDAVNQLLRSKVADTRGVNAETIKHSSRRIKKTLALILHIKVSKSCRRHPVADPPFGSPSCANSAANTSSSTHAQADQAGFRPGDSTTDHLCAVQELRQGLTSRRRSTQMSTAAYGGLCVNNTLRITVHTDVRSK